jgi:hypothetical protein
MLIGTTEIIVIICSSVVGVIIMLIFAYIYYRKFFANRKGLTEEEIEE